MDESTNTTKKTDFNDFIEQKKNELIKIYFAKRDIKELVKECHKLRKEYGNIAELIDENLICYALKMYKRYYERVIRNKKKNKKNG